VLVDPCGIDHGHPSEDGFTTAIAVNALIYTNVPSHSFHSRKCHFIKHRMMGLRRIVVLALWSAGSLQLCIAQRCLRPPPELDRPPMVTVVEVQPVEIIYEEETSISLFIPRNTVLVVDRGVSIKVTDAPITLSTTLCIQQTLHTSGVR
jgi:hypothetical protein